ncbi:MAG TPA: PRC-barrel domain-containing protein [Gammaproteobacteria bacterium]|nr:PRC-barrel domain-containing protein [Gammaproteobacteria bacterium]
MPAILLFVRKLKDNEIYDRQGNKLGAIDDVMLADDISRVRYVVLGFSESLSRPKKSFAVPVEALTLDTENECFVLDVPKARLAAAAGFDPKAPPPNADPLFEAATHA